METPGYERIFALADELTELASSSGVVYLFSPLPIIRKPILKPKVQTKMLKKGYFLPVNDENKPTPFFPHGAFTMGDWSFFPPTCTATFRRNQYWLLHASPGSRLTVKIYQLQMRYFCIQWKLTPIFTQVNFCRNGIFALFYDVALAILLVHVAL